MKITYMNDEVAGAGHGIFMCQDDDLTDAPHSLLVQRATDRKYLTETGDWNESQQPLALPSEAGNGLLSLKLGPALVNALTTQDTYKLTLTQGDTRKSGQFKIDEILYSADEALANAVVLEEKPQATPQPMPEEPVEVLGAENAVEGNEDKNSQKQSMPVQLQRKSVWPWIVAFFLLAGIAAALLWFFLWREPGTSSPTPLPKEEVATESSDPATPGVHEPSDAQNGDKKDPDPSIENTTKGTEPTASEEEKKTPELTTSEEKNGRASPENAAQEGKMPGSGESGGPDAAGGPQSQPSLSLQDEIKAFFAGNDRNGKKAAELAARLTPANGAEEDALFRLYYFAEQHGETSLLLPFAKTFDPSTPQWGSIEKNPVEALRLYEKSKAVTPEGAEGEASMRAWLIKAAEQGDRKAQEWLRLLPKGKP
ncbi:MAG: hypothetical protein K5657_03425 [Desulfovibrio sp.]|nr:hypothetical protein [Desulfovibrio sp.]